MTDCIHCGCEVPSNECCVWAKADAYDEMVLVVEALEEENKELRFRIESLEK